MTRKQKKELRQRQSTRQLMGILGLTAHGVKTASGELVFYLVKPDNLSVLSAEGIRGRVRALTDLLRSTPEVRLLALDSRESFQLNKDWYKERAQQEALPAVRELLRQGSAHLDEIQTLTASAREFAFVYRMEQGADDLQSQLLRMEKNIRELGFHVRLAGAQDVKRLLAVYYQQDVTTEYFETIDGERWLTHG